jgi:ABC-type oligopeptide transport system substrate-binding subunit
LDPEAEIAESRLALAASILLAACAAPPPAGAGSATAGGTVVYGATTEAANLDPLLAIDGSSA